MEDAAIDNSTCEHLTHHCFSAKELISLLAYFCECASWSAGLAHVVLLRNAQLCAMCILVVTLVHTLIVGSNRFTTLA